MIIMVATGNHDACCYWIEVIGAEVLEVVCVQHVNKHHNSYLFEEQLSPRPGVGKTITEEILTSS